MNRISQVGVAQDHPGDHMCASRTPTDTLILAFVDQRPGASVTCDVSHRRYGLILNEGGLSITSDHADTLIGYPAAPPTPGPHCPRPPRAEMMSPRHHRSMLMVTVPGEQHMSPHAGGQVAESPSSKDRRACKGSCNEPQDTTATHDTLSRETEREDARDKHDPGFTGLRRRERRFESCRGHHL